MHRAFDSRYLSPCQEGSGEGEQRPGSVRLIHVCGEVVKCDVEAVLQCDAEAMHCKVEVLDWRPYCAVEAMQ